MKTLSTPSDHRRARPLGALAAAAASLLVLAAASAAQADTPRTDAAAPQSTSAERRLNPQPEPPGVAAARRRSPDAAAAAKSPKADPWRRVVTKRYTPERLGLARDVSARSLARAAIERSARSLGLRSVGGVRLASESTPPAASSAGRELRTLRFQQSVGGLRVLWSEIDVAVVDGAVTSISATTVPFTQTRLQGRRRVSRARARALAKRALAGSETALPAQPVAYAGTPAKPWAPRRAWVVQLQPAKQDRGADHAETICVVVDADSGKVLMRYKGFVSQGKRPQGGAPRAQSAATPVFGTIFDAGGGTGQGQAIANWTGDPRPGGTTGVGPLVADWSSRHGASQAVFGINVPLSACRRRGFCVGHSIIHGQKVGAQTIIANSASPIGSHYSKSSQIITLETKHADNDDVIAHELGHRRDFTWADDRADAHQEVEEVQEALADMFAYDFDFDPSMFEDFTENFPGDEEKTGNRRYLKKPSDYERPDGAPYPDTMSQYRCADSTDEHINATILGHAYYLFVDQVGHEIAGDVLTYIPYALPPAPSFNDVAYWFTQRSMELYGGTVSAAAYNAFRTQAGIGIQTPHGDGCDVKPLQPKPPPSGKVCENKNPPPPECFTQSPPTRPELDPTE